MPHQPRRIVRKASRGVIPDETKEGVCEIIVVENADIVVDDIGDV